MDVKVYVISLPDRKIDHSLESLANKLGCVITLVPAITPTFNGCLNREFHFHRHFGRRVSCVELAISKSHILARKQALLDAPDVAAFFEDDAIISERGLRLIPVALDRFATEKMDHPAAIHLFPEQFGVMISSGTKDFNRILLIPDFAVGYVLNRKGIDVFNRFTKQCENWVADWPWIAYLLRWYTVNGELISHAADYASSSDAYKSRLERKKTRRRLKIDIGIIRFSLFRIATYFGEKTGSSSIPSEKLRSVFVSLLR